MPAAAKGRAKTCVFWSLSAILPVAFALLCIGSTVIDWVMWARLSEHGAATQGKIIQLHDTPSDAEVGPSYYVLYRWQPPGGRGEPFEREADVDKTTYQFLHEGDQIALRYDPDHPDRSRLESEIKRRPSELNTLWSIVFAAFCVVGVKQAMKRQNGQPPEA